MDIGRMKNNFKFYTGYEGEPEIVLSVDGQPNYSLHIWEGYITDIFEEPVITGKAWSGFTKDYHQLERIYGTSQKEYLISPREYFDDLMLYKNRKFDYEETSEVFELIQCFLKFAIDKKVKVKLKLN